MATQKNTQKSDTGKKAAAQPRSALRRHDPEQTARFFLIGGVALLIVVVLGMIAFGYYWTEVRPEHRTVLQVDDEKVSFAAMKRRMNYELFQSTSLQQDPTTLATVAYASLVQELVRISRSDELGVTVDDATFDAALRTRLGVPADADQRAFQDALRNQLDDTGLSESEFRRLVRSEALASAATEKFKAELPATKLQAKVEVITAPSLEVAQAAIARINAGEPFADVARDVSTDPNVAETAGVQDYQPEGGFNAAYDGFASTAGVGQISDPLPEGGNSTNHYVVRVIDRSDQPVREDQKDPLANRASNDWFRDVFTEMQSSGAIIDKFAEDDQNDALLAVIDSATPRLIEQQIEQQEAAAAQQTAVAALTANPATPEPPAAETPAAPPAPAP